MINYIDPDKVRELANMHRKWGEEGAWEPKTESSHTQIAIALESLLPAESSAGEWMRHELEKLRDDMERQSRLSSAFGTSGFVEATVAKRITRILKGES